MTRAKERRADFAARMNELGLGYEIVEAVDGRTLDMSKYAANAPLTASQIGCYLSHYKLWQRIIAEKIECAVILEDDAYCHDNFAETVLGITACRWQWDVVLLKRGKRIRLHRIVSPITKECKMVQFKNHSGPATGYCITYTAAKKLVNNIKITNLPVDAAWGHYWKWSGKFYCILPNIVKETGAPTQLQGTAPSLSKRRWRRLKIHIYLWIYYILLRPKKWD